MIARYAFRLSGSASTGATADARGIWRRERAGLPDAVLARRLVSRLETAR